MDAAKIMWVLYEHPETNFQDLAMRFMMFVNVFIASHKWVKKLA